MYKDQTYEVIKERILDENISNIDKKEGSFTNNMVSPIAVEFARTYMEFEHILNILFVTDAYGEYLDKRANEFGIYRKMGTKAKGVVRIYGAEDTVVPRNATLTTKDGLLFVVYRQDYIKSEYVDVVVEASEIGEIYNVDVNILWNTTISDGVNSIEADRVENNSKFIGGVDVETDDQLRERILEQARNPSTSGNDQDYINWCKEIDGVFNVTVRPLWNGPNTVKLIISDKDKQPLPDT
ncbi:MAG: baseplate J/gp47 family protein, partial [Clostridia bacterium]